jgi:hypothetical protein
MIQNQQHKHILGYFPFALDSMIAGGHEPESGVIVRVAEDDDEWETLILDCPVSRFDQSAADTLALVFRKHCCGT